MALPQAKHFSFQLTNLLSHIFEITQIAHNSSIVELQAFSLSSLKTTTLLSKKYVQITNETCMSLFLVVGQFNERVRIF
jgi:hypothetical protein